MCFRRSPTGDAHQGFDQTAFLAELVFVVPDIPAVRRKNAPRA